MRLPHPSECRGIRASSRGQRRRCDPSTSGRFGRNFRFEGRARDLAMFNPAIDSKLRGCDVVAIRVEDAQCSQLATVALRNPLSWIVLAFLAGVAVQRWTPMLWKKLPSAQAPSRQVTEWLSLMQAAERFVDPELMARDRKTRDKAQQFAQGTQEREDADYLAKHRREDVTGCLRDLLKDEKLVAKGCQLKIINGSTVVQPESAITNPFWGIIVGGMDCLVLEKNEAVGAIRQLDSSMS
jgi:hypothetical protein